MDSFEKTSEVVNLTISETLTIYQQLSFLYEILTDYYHYRDPFNPIEWLITNENTLTNLYAQLLKYKEKNRFPYLEIFIKRLIEKLKKDSLVTKYPFLDEDGIINSAIVYTEFSIPNGRLDLLIEMDEYSILIENKIYADLRYNQLRDYFEFFNRKEKPFILILLCPSYELDRYLLHKDVKDLLSNDFLIILHHDDFIIEWLEECSKATYEVRKKTYIEDIKNSIENFLGKRSNEIMNILWKMKEFVSIDIENRTERALEFCQILAATLYLTVQEQFERSLKSWNRDIKNRIKEIFTDYEIDGDIDGGQYSSIKVYKNEWEIDKKKFLFINIENQIKNIVNPSDWSIILKIGLGKNEDVNSIPDWLEKTTNELINLYNFKQGEGKWWYCYKIITHKINNIYENLKDTKLIFESLKDFASKSVFLNFSFNKEEYEKILNQITESLYFIKLSIEKI